MCRPTHTFAPASVYCRFFMGALGSSVKMFINSIFCSLYISYRSQECVLWIIFCNKPVFWWQKISVFNNRILCLYMIIIQLNGLPELLVLQCFITYQIITRSIWPRGASKYPRASVGTGSYEWRKKGMGSVNTMHRYSLASFALCDAISSRTGSCKHRDKVWKTSVVLDQNRLVFSLLNG